MKLGNDFLRSLLLQYDPLDDRPKDKVSSFFDNLVEVVAIIVMLAFSVLMYVLPLALAIALGMWLYNVLFA